jgi:hypothetical protein
VLIGFMGLHPLEDLKKDFKIFRKNLQYIRCLYPEDLLQCEMHLHFLSMINVNFDKQND